MKISTVTKGALVYFVSLIKNFVPFIRMFYKYKFTRFKLTVHSAITSKNFSKLGWALTKAPQGIVDKLKHRLHEGLKMEDARLGTNESKNKTTFFIPDEEQNEEILEELLPFHEAWSGVKLEPQVSYGLRVYRGEISLPMHFDKPATHVISSILHIDHGENDDPWPIVIEDFNGNTNEVFLESGDMLFYESSKCMHGRPKEYFGDYYSSLFTHYSPTEDWYNPRAYAASHLPEGVEEKWELDDGDIVPAETDGTLFWEPSCEHGYCGLKNTIKWYGPAPGYGKILSADGKVNELEGIPSETSFLDPTAAYKERKVSIDGMDEF